MRQQQTKRPPKHNQGPVPTTAQIQTGQSQTQKNVTGKENAIDGNQKVKFHFQDQSKRCKSNGGNVKSEVKRPQTALQKEKVVSPIQDNLNAVQRNTMHSTLNNPQAQKDFDEEHNEVDQLQSTQPQIFKSKYSSTRQQKECQSSGIITGKRVVQPTLCVQGEIESTERIIKRLSPCQVRAQSRDALQKRKLGRKKSNSNTIAGASSQHLKSTGRRQQKRGIIDFLEANLNRREIEDDEHNMTLKILHSSADIQKQSKSRANSCDRNKLQMKYLNFHRKSVTQNKAKSNKRSSANARQNENDSRGRKQMNKTMSTSADKIRRVTESLSPRSRTGSQLFNERARKHDAEALIKSAVDIPNGISTIRLDQALGNESELSAFALKNAHNNSALSGTLQHSNMQLSKNATLKPQLKYANTTERSKKVKKIIRESIKKELQALESRRKEQREREASSQRRRAMLEEKNQHIRKLNNEKIQRRRLRMKENLTIFGEDRDKQNTSLLEEELLAASQSINATDEKLIKKDSQHKYPLRLKNDESDYHGRTQGMDFLEVRKQVLNELKQVGKSSKLSNKKFAQGHNDSTWIDQTLNLKTSKSQKQDFAPLRQNHGHTQSLHQQTNSKFNGNLQQIKNENPLLKREKIRKFMKDKAKAFQAKAQRDRNDEIHAFEKVRCNLSKLNEFVQSKLNPLSGNSGVTTPALRVKKPHKRHTDVEERHRKSQIDNRNITPQRAGLFEQSDASLNISAKRQTGGRSILGQQRQKELQKMHDTLYEDSRLSSIDPHEERSGKIDPLKSSVCFEKSASQKNLRKQIRTSNSPQLKMCRNSMLKGRPHSAMSLQASKKRKVSKSQQKKKQRDAKNKRLIFPSQGKITTANRQNEDPDYAASIDISDSAKDNMTFNLKFTDQAAAVIIQREVRKYLGTLGFYEARQRGTLSPRLHSPDQVSNQIDIFIQPKSFVASKRSSPDSRKQRSTSNKSRRKSPNAYELFGGGKGTEIQLIMSPDDFRALQQKQYGQFIDSVDDEKPDKSDLKPQKVVKDLIIPSIPQLRSPLSHQNKTQSPVPESVPDAQSQSSTIFDRHSFQNYDKQKLVDLMKNNEYQKLIQFREECLVFREKKEKKHIYRLYRDNQLTPRTYKTRKEKIERWVSLQREELEQTKQGFQQEWEKTIQMIEETQRNMDFNRNKLGPATDSQSQTSSKQKQGIKISLIDEAPRSYRSGGQNTHTVKMSDLEHSQGVLTSRDSQKIDDHFNIQIEPSKKQSSETKSELIKPTTAKSHISPTAQQKLLNVDQFGNHQPSNSVDLDSIMQPSQEFISKLEKAAGLQHQSAEGTLSIEDQLKEQEILHSNDDPKNKVVKIHDINKLFEGSEEKSQSSHKSEPFFNDGPDQHANLQISEALQSNTEFRNNVNYFSQEEQPQQILVAVVPKKATQDEKADKITEAIIEQLLSECLVLPKRDQEKKQSPPFIADHDIFMIDTYSFEKEEKREWVEIRQRHLIEANLIRIDQYVNELVDLLLQFEIPELSEDSDFDYQIKPSDNLHIQFLKNLTQPIQRPPIECLELMQKSELGSYAHFETTLDINKFPIVTLQCYLEVEDLRQQQFKANKKPIDSKKQQVRDSVHILNKCIFDAVNESLMKFRPYGIVGQPMPWSNKVRRLQTKVEIASVDTERLFQMVKQEIFRWSQVFCGCLPGPIFSFPNPRTGKDEFSQEILQDTRERRLTQVLTQDTVEQEHYWLNYEFEEAQIKVDLSDMILETLVSEVISFLS